MNGHVTELSVLKSLKGFGVSSRLRKVKIKNIKNKENDLEVHYDIHH